MTFKTFLQDSIINITQFVTELRYAKKRDLSLKVKVKIVRSNCNIDTYDGIITDNRKFLIVEKIGRFQINPKEFFDDREGRIIFLPEKFHGDIDYENRINAAAEAEKNEALIAWQNGKTWCNMKVVSRGCIDWRLMDNEYSYDFGIDAFLVSRGSIFDSVLKQTPNFKLLLIALSCLLIGYIFGFGSNSLLNILLYIIIKVV